MFCKYCGKDLLIESKFCPYCGKMLSTEISMCAHCGKLLENDTKYCSNCGNEVFKNESEKVEDTPKEEIKPAAVPKSKTIAGILGIIFGFWGVHNFYLGFTNKGAAQLICWIVGLIIFAPLCLASVLWGIIEGIMILCGKQNKDANGNPLL